MKIYNKQIDTFYYYKSKDKECKIIYYALKNDDDEIIELKSLNFGSRNYPMNSYFYKSFNELKRFREELKLYNKEIESHYFETKNKKKYKINLFNSYSTELFLIENLDNKTDKTILKSFEVIDKKEFYIFENCIKSGIQTFNKDYKGIETEVYYYDFSKFYYEMMKRIKIPISKPIYINLSNIDFNKLDYGIYRVKIICENKTFLNIFRYNTKNFYNSTTLNRLYKYKEKYNIEFKLLTADDNFDFNFVKYENTIKVKELFKEYFKVCDKLLKSCSKSNWLLKALVSIMHGIITKYNKIIIDKDELRTLDYENIENIEKNNISDIYEYYLLENDLTKAKVIKSDDAYKYKGLGRMKTFLTEFCRTFIFEFINDNNLESNIIAINIDGLVLNKKVDDFKGEYVPKLDLNKSGKFIYESVKKYKKI